MAIVASRAALSVLIARASDNEQQQPLIPPLTADSTVLKPHGTKSSVAVIVRSELVLVYLGDDSSPVNFVLGKRKSIPRKVQTTIVLMRFWLKEYCVNL